MANNKQHSLIPPYIYLSFFSSSAATTASCISPHQFLLLLLMYSHTLEGKGILLCVSEHYQQTSSRQQPKKRSNQEKDQPHIHTCTLVWLMTHCVLPPIGLHHEPNRVSKLPNSVETYETFKNVYGRICTHTEREDHNTKCCYAHSGPHYFYFYKQIVRKGGE